MKRCIKLFEAYDFSELPEASKEVAKHEYLDSEILNEGFFDWLNEDIKIMFPNSDLKVQYSLSYCQGDGVNIYGNLDLYDVFNYSETKEKFTEGEMNTIATYMSIYTKEIILPYNVRGCFCCADRIDIVGEFEDELEYAGIQPDKDLLQRLEDVVKDKIINLCVEYENCGYEYLYKIKDEEFEEIANTNEWLFNKKGNLICDCDIDYVLNEK